MLTVLLPAQRAESTDLLSKLSTPQAHAFITTDTKAHTRTE